MELTLLFAPRTLVAIGLAGSLLMFLGDTLLYWRPQVFRADGVDALAPAMRIMAGLPQSRIIAGSLLGPLASPLYLAGFAGVALQAKGAFAWVVHLGCLALVFGLVLGAAFHAQFAHLAVAQRTGDERLVREARRVALALAGPSFAAIAVGWVAMLVAALAGALPVPLWFALLTPPVMKLLSLVWAYLPVPVIQPLLFGGWNNLVFAIFFTGLLAVA